MKMRKKRTGLLPVVALFILLGGQHGMAGETDVELELELDEAERAELQVKLEEARVQLDEAAARLGELHGKLYSMEIMGSHGQKPMLGVLIGSRGENGGLELVGVTPGGGAGEAGLSAGDELTAINNVDLTSAESAMDALRDAMSDVSPGDAVSVGYYRDGSFATTDVTTRAKGVFIMGMTGAPDVDIHLEGLEALEEMGERLAESFEDVDFTANMEWVENLEVLEDIGPQVSTMVHRAIRIGGGLRLEDVSEDLAQYFGVNEGVLVIAVPDSSPEIGLKGGDIIVAVNGEDVSRSSEVYRAFFSTTDESISVDIVRQGINETVDLDAASLGEGRHRTITIRSGDVDAPDDMEVRVIAPDSP